MPRVSKKLLISHPYWQRRLEDLSHPAAIRMAEDLDPSGPLGIGSSADLFWKGFKHDYGRKDSSIDFLLQVKKKHAEKIVLVQVGEFYETWGLDSVFLVEHGGLNRMGKKGPRAGFPLVHIQTILDRLTGAGFSVVVCEQAEGVTRRGRKMRFIAEVVSPESPVYTHGLAMDKMRWQVAFPEGRPVFALSEQKRGVMLVEVFADLRAVHVFEGLTEEAARVRLARFSGRLGKVYLHESIEARRFHLDNDHIERVTGYSPKNFPARVVQLLQKDLGLSARQRFHYVVSQWNKPGEKDSQPRPLYLATAQQMGLMHERGIPELTPSLLPKGSPLTCHEILRSFLLVPPPPKIAQSLRRTLSSLGKATLPPFIIGQTSQYVKTLQRGECSPDTLRDLQVMASHFLKCESDRGRESAGLVEAMPEILQIVSYLSYLPADQRTLRQSCLYIQKRLAEVLPQVDDLANAPESEWISPHLFAMLEEEFRGRISKTANLKVLEAYKRVDLCASKYQEKLQKDLLPLVEGVRKKRTLSYDLFNRSIWLRGSIDAQEVKKRKLITPRDRYGKEIKDRWTTRAVENALLEYKASVNEARREVALVLQETSQKLAKHSHSIVQISTFSNLMRTLHLHAREGRQRGWSLSYRVEERGGGHRLLLRKFFPYWMQKDKAIANDLSLQDMALLTGHNMAGKSTALRASAVATLLAASGLYFPAESMSLSEVIDGWFVRTGTQDDPASGLSAFAVEMNDMRIALQDATHQSLIFVDELGKGTESCSGHAIAGSVFERLRSLQVRGLFATHWHELFSNPKMDLSDIQKLYMQEVDGRPTYCLQEGCDLTSSAFTTALQMGIDRELIDRAQEIQSGASLEHLQEGLGMVADSSVEYRSFSMEEVERLIFKTAPLRRIEVKTLSSEQHPPLKDCESVVYVLRTKKGFYYVGETDDLTSRLESHRQSRDKTYSEVLYFEVSRGKSQARKIESHLIDCLRNEGFPMLSVQDALHRRFSNAEN